MSDAKKGSNPTVVERSAENELLIKRTFDGPVRIVFDAWTKPDLLKRWWAPKALGVTLFSCEIDLRVGGRYRHVFGRDEKNAMAFSGTYTEVTPLTGLAFTQVFEPMANAGEAIITVSFEEVNGKTNVVSRERFPSKQVLDGVIASGMEQGMRETFEQLEALIASLL